MPARAGDFEGALGRLLAVDVAQIDRILRRLRKQFSRIHLRRSERLRRIYQVYRLRQRTQSKHLHAFDHGCFARVGFRNGERAQSSFPRGQRGGKSATHGPHAAVERQFTEEHAFAERFAEERTQTAEQPQRHRKIEPGAFLAHVGRREIDGHTLPVGEFVAAVFQRGLDSFAAFLDGVVRQSDNIEVLHSRRADVYLDLDEIGINPVHRGADRLKEHARGERRSLPAARAQHKSNEEVTPELLPSFSGFVRGISCLALPVARSALQPSRPHV